MPVEVTDNLPDIARELDDQISAAMKRGAELVAENAKERVPVRTGALKRAIHIEFKGGSDWDVVAGNNEAFYGHIVEHGGVHTAPRPFLVPALEARRAAVEAAVAEALQHL